MRLVLVSTVLFLSSMVGSDQWGTEVQPNPDPGLALPVHQESPGRPLAIR